MTDTPETDLLCGEVVPAKFARRLERERDKAISRFEALKEFLMLNSEWMPPMQTIHDKIIPELIRRREAKDRSREIITKLASKAKEAQS
jgi:hypothetical protein